MTKRFCDVCGAPIEAKAAYFLEQLRAMDVIVGAIAGQIVVFQRDLCRACVPEHARGALPPVDAQEGQG